MNMDNTILLENESVLRLTELLREAKHVVIVTHMGPDGDAMGSSLAWKHYLCSAFEAGSLSAERSVDVIVPNAFPSFFNWMPGAGEVHVYENETAVCDRIIEAVDLFLCTDFNDPKRIGPVGEKMLANACPKAVIDHHLPDKPIDWSEVVFSFPGSPSASGEPVIPSLLEFVMYCAISTDTGNFSFNSNHPEMYEIVAELVRAGVDKDAVYNAVFNQHSENRMRLWGYALYRKMKIYPEYHAALMVLDADELDKYKYQVGDTEGLVNMPLRISDVYYSVFIREERAKPGTPHSRIRLSFRSQGDRPVNMFAHEIFRGGGHANASGGELYGTVGQAVRMFERNMGKYLKRD